MTSPCPFDMQGLDVVGPINSKARNGHTFILVAIDQFIKWVEARSYIHVTYKVVKRFIEKDLICRYGLLTRLVTNNAKTINEKMIVELYIKYKVNLINSPLYRPKMNEVIEAANKNLKKIFKKMVVIYKDWSERLNFPYLIKDFPTYLVEEKERGKEL